MCGNNGWLKVCALVLGLASFTQGAPIVINVFSGGPNNTLSATTADGSRTIAYNQTSYYSNVGYLKDINGVSTGIAMCWVAGQLGAYNSNSAGYVTGSTARSIFPDEVMRTFIGSSTPTANFMRWRFDGLRWDAEYDFVFLSAREGTGNSSTKFTLLGSNTATGSINPKGNSAGALVEINGIRPDKYGSIELVVGFGSGNTGFTYFNALQIEERVLSSNVSVPEPATGAIMLLAIGGCAFGHRRRIA